MNLYKIVLSVLFVICVESAFCQQSLPIFKNKQDSVSYNQVTKAIQIFFKKPRSIGSTVSSSLDSLMDLQRTLRSKAIAFKDIYKSKNFFTSYDDLKQGKIKPEQVVRLSFDDARLTVVPDEIYSCVNLIEVEFVNTAIKKIPSKLKSLTHLKTVALYNNNIATRLILPRNSTIHQLTIKGTKASVLPKKFRRLKALDTLNLSKNIGMVSFPNISSNKKLKRLMLAENNLTLVDLKRGSTSLTDLSIRKNKIEIVPAAIDKFPNLKELQLSYNSIYEVNPAIGRLKNLETLSLYDNKLTAIPAGLFQLSNLTTIDLYFNRLDDVDEGIGNLTKLKILYLSNNFIKSLPTSIGKLKDLARLYVHHNQLDSLPISLSQLKQLQIVGLNDNHLKELPGYFFDFTYLEDLDVSDNEIKVLPLEWSTLSRLQLLNISGNHFKNDEEVKKVVAELKGRGIVCNY